MGFLEGLRKLFNEKKEISSEENSLKIFSYINAPNYLNEKPLKKFYLKLITLLIKDFYDPQIPLHQQFKNELEEIIFNQIELFNGLVDTRLSLEAMKLFNESFILRCETKFCTPMVNLDFAFCWYQIIKKLNQDIGKTNDISLINTCEKFLSNIEKIAKRTEIRN